MAKREIAALIVGQVLQCTLGIMDLEISLDFLNTFILITRLDVFVFESFSK